MSAIRIRDMGYVAFSAPDLDRMRAFLKDFGLRPSDTDEDSSDVLHMRGMGSTPFLHRTVIGEPGFHALGLRAESVADLETLAKAEGVEVEDAAGPGGGSVVVLHDPDGRRVEIVAGQAEAEAVPLQDRPPGNQASTKARLRAVKRIEPGPANVVRLGHVVLEAGNFVETRDWYQSRFGFLTSDEIEMAPGMTIGAFMRLDRGAEPTDHHALFILQGENGPAFQHAAFEVEDVDDLMRGHAHLASKATEHGASPSWGVGRHIVGSQIFDYWRDPWGHEVEHWTDGDLFTADDPPGKAGLHELIGVQWGPEHPMMERLRAMQAGEEASI